LSRFLEDKERLQQIVRFVSHELDSMTCWTDVDVFLDVFVYVVSEIFFFQQIENSFVLEMISVRVIMILFQKFSFEKFLKKCIICFLSAINRSQYFTWTTSRDRHSCDYCSTRRRHFFSNQEVSRFRSFCHASSMLFRQKIVLVAQTNQIVAKYIIRCEASKTKRWTSFFCSEHFLSNLSKQDLRYSRRFRVQTFSKSFRCLETMIWKKKISSKFFSQSQRFSFFSRNSVRF
jgi:hypothetical protein